MCYHRPIDEDTIAAHSDRLDKALTRRFPPCRAPFRHDLLEELLASDLKEFIAGLLVHFRDLIRPRSAVAARIF